MHYFSIMWTQKFFVSFIPFQKSPFVCFFSFNSALLDVNKADTFESWYDYKMFMFKMFSPNYGNTING